MINSGLLGRQGYRAWVAALSLILTFSLMMSQFAYAAIAFRAASSGNNAGGANSLSISMPTGVVEGDVMIAVISVRGGTGTAISTVPTGWAMINSNNSTTDIKSAMYYKIAITSEAGPYVWGWGSSLKASGVLSAYSGVDNSAPIMTHSNQVNTSGTSMTAPSVVTTADGAWIIAAYSTATGTTVSAGSSMDLRGQSASTGAGAGSRTTSGLQDIVQTSAGSSGTKTMTASSAAVNVGHTIALNPVASFEQSGYRWFVNADSTALPTFAQTWGGDSNDSNGTLAVALDSSGNIFTVGSTASSGMTAGSDDQSLVKYNSSGVEQWSKTWGGDGFDYANAVTFDTSGNIYVVGSTASTGWTAGSYDHTLVKYNSSGVEQWSKTWGGSNDDRANSIVLDTLGDIYVSGYANSTGLTAGGYDQTLVKYNSSGVEQWSKTWGGAGSDSAYSLDIDNSNNIYVAGNTNSTGLTSGGYDQTLVKYNSSGVEQWSKTWGGDGSDYSSATIVDSSGDIFVVGYTDSTGLTSGGYDQTLVKYNSSGVEQWSKTWGGTAADKAQDIILDASGGINVVGDTASTELSAGLLDQTLLRFDSNGEIANCSSCVDRTVTEVDRTTSETDRTVTEVDRTTSETDRTVTEVDRTGIATITLVCDGTPAIDVDSPLGGVAQNTSAIAPEAQQIFRLRLLLHVSAGSALGGHAFKLQYASMSGACDTSFTGETYADVTTVSTIAYADNTNAVEGQSLVANANDPTHTGHTKIAQEYNESNNTISKNTVAPGQDGLWDFALKDNGAPAGENYCFRIVRSDNSFLSTYSFIPQIAIASDLSGPTIEQQLRGGQSVVDGVKQGFTW